MTRAIVVLIALTAATLPEAGGFTRRHQHAAQAPLPDRDTFFAEVRKRLASNQLLQSRFTYKERVTELNLNPLGRMGTGPVETFEVYPVHEELTYRRVIERDGQAVPAAEIAAEDRRFLARYHAWQHEVAREGSDARAARQKRLEEARRKDREKANEILEMLDFALDRRELKDGEPAIVIRFRPRPNAQPASREARFAHGFAGQVWVHEREYEVMNVEADAVSDVSFGFGMLARLHKGAKASTARRPFDGTWLPSETRFHGTGRALLLRKVTFKYEHQYFDYRPFDAANLPALLAASGRSSR